MKRSKGSNQFKKGSARDLNEELVNLFGADFIALFRRWNLEWWAETNLIRTDFQRQYDMSKLDKQTKKMIELLKQQNARHKQNSRILANKQFHL